MRFRKSAIVIVQSLFAISLTACGGGNAPQPPPPAPLFTSTPPTAAIEAAPYTYTLSATDPAGGTVSFALVNGPVSASISASTLTWTPAHNQSRTANTFSVTATTSEGGIATQGWSVTPSGTINVSWVDTHWTSAGPVAVPVGDGLLGQSLAPAALLPNGDGSWTTITGNPFTLGLASIPAVPAGHYFLRVAPFAFYWTATSDFDFGADIVGQQPQAAPAGTPNSSIALNVSSLTPTQEGDWFTMLADFSDFDFSLVNGFLLPLGTTTLSMPATLQTNLDLAQTKNLYLMQYQFANNPLNVITLSAQQSISSPNLQDGVANVVNGNLIQSPATSLEINIKGSAWASLFNNVSAATPSGFSSTLSVSAQPYVTDRNATPWITATGPDLPLITRRPVTDFVSAPPLSTTCSDVTGLGTPAISTVEAPILTDQDFGIISYGDPFPSTWPRFFTFCETANVEQSGANVNTSPYMIVVGQTTELPTGPVVPILTPPQQPTINGASLFTSTTLDTTAVTLAWSAPATGSPFGYYVHLFNYAVLPNNGSQFASAGKFGTIGTSLALPPLTPGTTYFFVITAEADAKASMETSPNRSQLPTAFASVISAPFTISSSAAAPAVRHH